MKSRKDSGKSVGDLIGIYLDRVGDKRTLTQAEEVATFKTIEQLRADILTFKSTSDNPRATEDLENATQKLLCEKKKVILANLRLVLHYARKRAGDKADLDDLIQEGNIGLMKAVDKFDYKLGFRFSTYASWWIKQRIYDFANEQGGLIHLSKGLIQTTKKIKSAQFTHEKLRGTKLSPSKLSEATGEPQSRIDSALSAMAITIADLDEELPDDDSRLLDITEDPSSPDPELEAAHRLLAECIDSVLNTMPRKAASILRLRYGLGQRRHGKELTLTETSTEVGLGRERVRQIQAEALEGMANNPKLRDFKL